MPAICQSLSQWAQPTPIYVPRWNAAMLRIKNEQEGDGRWIAEIPALPGVLVYGSTNSDANAKAKVLALRVIADRLENGELLPREIADVFEAAWPAAKAQPVLVAPFCAGVGQSNDRQVHIACSSVPVGQATVCVS